MAKTFELSIMTPRNNFFQGEVTQLNIEIANGRIGFLADHIPLVSSIKTSKFSIIENGYIKEGVIMGGIIYMDGKEASVITSRVKWLEDIDLEHVNKRIDVHTESLNKPNISKSEKEILKQKIIYYESQKV